MTRLKGVYYKCKHLEMEIRNESGTSLQMNHAYSCWVETVAPWDVVHVMWHTRTNFLEELAYLSTKLHGLTWQNSIM